VRVVFVQQLARSVLPGGGGRITRMATRSGR
jgi:hypothetical protein